MKDRHAREPARLATIRVKLAANPDTCPMFDVARTRSLESAWTMMRERAERGEKPRNVPASGVL